MLRAAAVLVLVAFSGCTANLAPSLPDIAAPEPVDRYPALHELFADDEPFTLRGRVTDPDGRPVAGALVWVEAEDLRQPVNNLAAYSEGRAATIRNTAADGTFRIQADDGLYSIAVEAPGFRALRSVPLATSEPLELRLSPHDGVLVMAHRGASFYAPENTIASIQKAAWLGADWVEVDVRLTRDGRLVLIHDMSLERTTGQSGEVASTSWSQLRTLDAGAWFHSSFANTQVPSLAEAIQAARDEGTRLVLDIKAPDAREAARVRSALFLELDALGAKSEVVVAAFRNATVDDCVRSGLACAKISAGASDMAALLDDAWARGVSTVMLDQAVVDASVVATAHRRGLSVHAWTVNDEPSWRRLLAAGVDGILTDRPGYLLDVLNDRPAQEVP